MTNSQFHDLRQGVNEILLHKKTTTKSQWYAAISSDLS